MSGSYTERFTEVHYPLVGIAPATYSAAAEQITSYVSLASYHRAVLVIHLGAFAAGGTVQFRLLQATDTAGTSPKGIPTTATQDKITTVLTAADTGWVAIELRTEELDVTGGYDCEYELTTDEMREKVADVRNYEDILPKRSGVDWDYWQQYYRERAGRMMISDDAPRRVGQVISDLHPANAFGDWLLREASVHI